MAPLCVKDKRKAQAAAAAAAATAAPANGQTSLVPQRRESGPKSAAGGVRGGSCSGANAGGACSEVPPRALALPSPCRPPPVVIQRSEIINMALAYTSCAGCSAAVKGLLQRPIEELRLVNAVVEESDGAGSGGGGGSVGSHSGGGGKGCSKGDVRLLGNGDSGGGCGRGEGSSSCGHGCGNRHAPVEGAAGPSCGQGTCGQATSAVPGGLPRALSLREAYLTDRARLDQVWDAGVSLLSRDVFFCVFFLDRRPSVDSSSQRRTFPSTFLWQGFGCRGGGGGGKSAKVQ